MLQVSELHRLANDRLRTMSGDPKRLTLIHAAIALGSSFLVMLVSYLLGLQMENTGGLDGVGLRSILETAESTLVLIVSMALPFWQIGLFYAALQWARGEEATFGHLFQGFRRMRAVLGFLLLESLVFISLAIAIFNISTVIFTMLPISAPFMEALAPITAQATDAEALDALLTPEFAQTFTTAAIPLFILFGALYLAIAIPVFYRLRFANFAVMEGLPAGKALVKSMFITKGRFWQVLRVDLSFWWFYLLQILSVALCYGDALLAGLGILLPIPEVVAAFGFYALGLACQCVLLWQFEARRVTVYALAYDDLVMPRDNDNTIITV